MGEVYVSDPNKDERPSQPVEQAPATPPQEPAQFDDAADDAEPDYSAEETNRKGETA